MTKDITKLPVENKVQNEADKAAAGFQNENDRRGKPLIGPAVPEYSDKMSREISKQRKAIVDRYKGLK